MSDYKISVIIPVYNAEKTMERTINSILMQNTLEIEIILVDDGSTDSSYAKCDEYASKYSFIKVVHKHNGGLSSARNEGLKIAVGKYITFIDSDDYYSYGVFEETLNVIDEFNPDLIYFGWQYVVNGEVQPKQIKDFPKKMLMDKTYIRKVIIPPMINIKSDVNHFIDDYSCNKFYKNEIINRHNIRFDETRRIWEDRPFVVQYLKHCNSFYALEGYYYNYVQVIGSLSSKYYKNFFEIILQNYKLYKKLFGDEYDFETTYVNTYWRNSIENMIIRTLNEKKNKKELKGIIKRTLSDPIVHAWYNGSESEEKFSNRL